MSILLCFDFVDYAAAAAAHTPAARSTVRHAAALAAADESGWPGRVLTVTASVLSIQTSRLLIALLFRIDRFERLNRVETPSARCRSIEGPV